MQRSFRHRNLGGYAHNLASFYAQRQSGFLALATKSVSERLGIDSVSLDLLIGNITPAEMDRLLVNRLVEYGQACLIKVLPNCSESSPAADHLANAIIEFQIEPDGIRISATLEDHFGHRVTRTVSA